TPRRCSTSTSRSWKPSTPSCASNSGSGTRRRRSSATWWPASIRCCVRTWGDRMGWPTRTSSFSTHAAARERISLKCCGAIAATLREKGEDALLGGKLKKAATSRLFGFEILPAPFVVAHLQIGLFLQGAGVPLEEGKKER